MITLLICDTIIWTEVINFFYFFLSILWFSYEFIDTVKGDQIPDLKSDILDLPCPERGCDLPITC